MNLEDESSGLYVGFEGYRSATEADLVSAAQNWLVVLDTNVLLNLYNYQGSSLDDFVRVFEALGDRLFVPHQVLDEFWRNRRVVLSENQGRNREQETVQKAFDEIEATLPRWHQRVVDRTNPPPPGVTRELDEAREVVLAHMTKMNSLAQATLPDTPTHEDRVLRKLEPILSGRVGLAPDAASLITLRADGKARIASKIPPGYMDGEKKPERAVGDYLVWRQTMDASKQRQLSVLLVTQDQKEDWWADRGTRSMRARPELVSELLRFAGQRLLMIRSPDLVRLGVHLGVEVRQSTLDEAQTMSTEIDGWSLDVVSEYLELLAGWPEHFQILLEAVQSGGEIPRSRIAEILDREPSASLRGTGRPFKTALGRLKDQRELQVPLFATYETGGYMSHFTMPEDLVSLFITGVANHQARTTAP